MNIGIIAEYNPFHNGHLYHIYRAKQLAGADDVNIIAVMSGDFVQRGEPAAVDKFTRTKIALKNGVDLVIELPVVYATASAEYFAYGAVRLLDSLTIIDAISFGTESGDINELARAVSALSDETEDFKNMLKHELKKGGSYPSAREKSLALLYSKHPEYSKDLSFFSQPNNILAIEYLKALKKLGSKIIPIPVKRNGSEYNSLEMNGDICSAAAIRQALTGCERENLSRFMPSSAYEIFMRAISSAGIASLNNYSDIFQFLLKTKSPRELAGILDVGEGLENRLQKSGEQFFALDDILTATKTKRYTMARLRRAALHIILQIRRDEAMSYYSAPDPGYIRVLGFNKGKSFLLRQIRRQAAVPVITRVRKESADLPSLSYNMLQTELRASDMYKLSLNDKKPFRRNNDFYTNIHIPDKEE